MHLKDAKNTKNSNQDMTSLRQKITRPVPTLEDTSERGSLITIYKLMDDLEVIGTDLLKGEREAGCLRGHEKIENKKKVQKSTVFITKA